MSSQNTTESEKKEESLTHAWVQYDDFVIDCVRTSEVKNFHPKHKNDFDKERKLPAREIFWPSKVCSDPEKASKKVKKVAGYFLGYILCVGGWYSYNFLFLALCTGIILKY
jgi:hypothetical protein